jgi:hypothetical protein
MKVCIVAVIFTLFIASSTFGAPSISGVSGRCIHSQGITIDGAGFGIKEPASPLVWDDGMSSPDLNVYYDEVLPTNAQQGSYYNMGYRQTPFRGISAPHGRMRYILGGAHATSTSSGQYLSGNNVSIGKNLRSFRFFAHYWYRVDPNFDEENHANYGDNMKEICLSGEEGQIYGGNWGYYNWCNSHVPDRNFTGPVRLARQPVDCPNLSYACSDDAYGVSHNSPINGWIKMQWEGSYNTAYDNPTVRFTTYPDGHVTDSSHYGNGITTSEILWGCGYPDANALRFLGLGGFARVPRTNNGRNSFRYFAGVYIDDTVSRVMLGNNRDYELCTKMEPQIPSQWSSTSITVTVNLGSFQSGETGYLFVFDGNNQRNAEGYPVVIGENPDPPPSPPQNLRIISNQ